MEKRPAKSLHTQDEDWMKSKGDNNKIYRFISYIKYVFGAIWSFTGMICHPPKKTEKQLKMCVVYECLKSFLGR